MEVESVCGSARPTTQRGSVNVMRRMFTEVGVVNNVFLSWVDDDIEV